MLFFRSEEAIRGWCSANGFLQRPTVTIAQLWQLSLAWYATRLEPSSRRPAAAEIEEIFARIGLEDEFWNPASERHAAEPSG